MTQTRQLSAIMFTDIVGYTALMGNNEEKAFELIRKNREIQKPIIEEFGGRWIKELGDGVMATFPAVSKAVYAAIKIQEECHKTKAFELRIGIHQGEVVFENDDIFGDAVNIASRLQSLAPPSGIYVSESVQRDLANKSDIKSEFVAVENLKNVKEPVQVYKIFSKDSDGAATVSQRPTKSSILPGYNYDVHISYRYSDNKYDGWVMEFFDKLQRELNATLKDKLTIFFDKNLNEDVQPSTPSEINSLIFIPIISQTYCDVKAFAWKNEFLEFKKESENDKLGKNIRLTNGNIASRVLPIKIHDIDVEDLHVLENELSGVLRSVDFIYREAGVNRPLRPVDDELEASSSRVLYRNQINKVANAIKEIIQGIKLSEKNQAPQLSSQDIAAEMPVKSASYSTSLPAGIKVQVVDRQKPSIYLSWTSNDLKEQREEMSIVLQKAGFNVLPSTDCPADDELFKKKVAEEIKQCSCSLHMLSGEFGRRFEQNDEMSFPQFQFLEAKKMLESGSDFNSFVWMVPDTEDKMKSAQQEFIKYIRNNITKNMMFSNSPGPMQLVDDIRVVMMKQDVTVYDSKDTDIFFIFNQQDEESAKVITDKLSNEYPVEIMNILPDGEDEYREISSQQIPKSKLAVVYFKYAGDWALPFIKQIWKQVGGASSPTHMFLVGEDDPYSNKARNFKAPKVVSTIIPKENIPSEVKKVYTTVIKIK
ncbi:MAG: adenylate/guanylate cyclase domain-containing protein [Flammeovirgaceae bacterium]|nr:adenylate/guanylate cyclase domain-containing protein [Flammeovirgaceae bacterium]